jgi:hypothetical protein
MPRSGANLLLFYTTAFHPTITASFGGHGKPALTHTLQPRKNTLRETNPNLASFRTLFTPNGMLLVDLKLGMQQALVLNFDKRNGVFGDLSWRLSSRIACSV